jgi:hypothetical protein
MPDTLSLAMTDILEATVELRRQTDDRVALPGCLKALIVDCAREGLFSAEEAEDLINFYGLRGA